MDPIASRTLLTVVGLFAGALIATFFADRSGRRKGRITGVGNLWLRYLSWLVIAPLFLITAYWGNPVFYVFGAAMVVLYVEEFYAITGVARVGVFKWEGRIFAAVALWAASVSDKSLFYCLPMLVITVVVTTPIVTRRTEDVARLTAMTILGVLYFAWMFAYIVFIRESFGFGGVVFVCGLVTVSDVLCFAVGKAAGRRRLIPQISPGKTVEGAVGGVVGTVSAAALFQFALPDWSYLECAALALVLAISAQLGDLVVSAVKRDAHIKDTGTLIPGHGGVLDRFDSWIYSMPIAFYAMRFIAGGR